MLYSIYILYLLVIFFVSIYIAHYTWHRREVIGATSLTFFLLVAALWSICDVFSALSPNEEWAYFFDVKIRFFAAASAGPAIFLFAAEYTGYRQWFKPSRLALLFTIPIVTQFVIWFGPSDAFFSKVNYVSIQGFQLPDSRVVGRWFHIYAGYVYTFVFIGITLFTIKTLNTKGIYRRQAALLLSGLLFIIFISIIRTYGDAISLNFDIVIIGYSVTLAIWMVAIFRYGFLEIGPVAHDLLIENMQDMVIVLDAQERIVEINPAAYPLITTNPIYAIGQPAKDTLRYWTTFVESFSGTEETQTKECLDPQGNLRHFELYTSLLKDRLGASHGRIIVIRDITLHKQAQQSEINLELAHVRRKLLNTFITQATHEFRTPLSIITTSAYLLERLNDRDGRSRHVNSIETQVKAINNLVNNLTTLSVLDNDTQLTFHRVNLNTIIKNIYVSRKNILEDKSICAEKVLGDSPMVLADITYLQEAIEKIVDNAIQFTPIGGTIITKTCTDGTNAVIKIIDSGHGINPDILPSVFEYFYRTDTAGTSRGFGLGLPIANAIIEKHKGTIDVQSNFGSGTTVIISLPLHTTNLATTH